MEMIHEFYKDTSGITMVEYALMLTFVALACFTGVQALGTSVLNSFNDSAAGFSGS